MRLFVAIEAPPAWQRVASEAQATLAAAVTGSARANLRLVDPALMHLTLRFLGEVDAASLEPLQQALSERVRFVDVKLVLTAAGTFGPAQRTSVVWLGIGGELEELGLLAERVEDAVRDAGLPPSEQPFSPHLTLARASRRMTAPDRRAIAAAAAAMAAPDIEMTTQRVTEIALVRSHLGGAQPRYEVIGRYPIAPAVRDRYHDVDAPRSGE